MRFKIDWSSLIVESKSTVFALFYFVLEGNFPSTSPSGAYIWTGLGGLYLEGLIFGILRYYKFDLHLSIPIYISVYVTHCFPPDFSFLQDNCLSGRRSLFPRQLTLRSFEEKLPSYWEVIMHLSSTLGETNHDKYCKHVKKGTRLE